LCVSVSVSVYLCLCLYPCLWERGGEGPLGTRRGWWPRLHLNPKPLPLYLPLSPKHVGQKKCRTRKPTSYLNPRRSKFVHECIYSSDVNLKFFTSISPPPLPSFRPSTPREETPPSKPFVSLRNFVYECNYGVATISRRLKITGLFCKRAL